MRSSSRRGVGIALILVLIAGQPFGRAAEPKARLSGPVEEVLWWLPEDTETILVAQGPRKVEDRNRGKPDGLTIRDVPTFFLIEIDTVAKLAREKEITLTVAIKGTRRVRYRPALTGMILPSEGASVLVFRDPLGPLAAKLMKPNEPREAGLKPRPRPKLETIAGQSVLVEEEEYPDGQSTYFRYTAVPRPNVVIFATDRDYLKTTLERMAAKGKARALPESLPEWTFLDPAAESWALRHYRKADAASDPSSPLNVGDNRAVRPDPKAIGLVVAAVPGDGATGSLHLAYLTGDPKPDDLASALWGIPPAFGVRPDVRRSGPGAAKMIYRSGDIKDDRAYRALLFQVIISLGYVPVI